MARWITPGWYTNNANAHELPHHSNQSGPSRTPTEISAHRGPGMTDATWPFEDMDYDPWMARIGPSVDLDDAFEQGFYWSFHIKTHPQMERKQTWAWAWFYPMYMWHHSQPSGPVVGDDAWSYWEVRVSTDGFETYEVLPWINLDGPLRKFWNPYFHYTPRFRSVNLRSLGWTEPDTHYEFRLGVHVAAGDNLIMALGHDQETMPIGFYALIPEPRMAVLALGVVAGLAVLVGRRRRRA